MRKSWSARGLLSPLWGRVGGRDGLAERTGIHGPTLSGYNTGRQRMGEDAGRRIAAALGVTLEELGAPPDPAHPSLIMAELAALREQIASAVQNRSDWQAEIQGQLDRQVALLAELSAVSVDLAAAVKDLREATAALRQETR